MTDGQFDPRHVRPRQGTAPFWGTTDERAVYALPPEPPRTIVPMSGLAAAAFTLGVLAFMTFGVTSIPAVICGHRAQRHTATGLRGGHGLAVVGALLGWLAVAGWVLFWTFLSVGLAGSLRGVQ